jgi:hypothetical protein
MQSEKEPEKEPVVVATEALLEKAEDCFVLAQSHHMQAEIQHDGASRQLINAAAQEEIATRQHCYADNLETKAKTLEDLGYSLRADAAKLKRPRLEAVRTRT